jgi:hypothetical protein
MRHGLLALAVTAFYALHQDLWLWRRARPLVFGFLPAGLFYHVAYSLGAAFLMWLLVATAWPARLEEEAGPREGEDRRR